MDRYMICRGMDTMVHVPIPMIYYVLHDIWWYGYMVYAMLPSPCYGYIMVTWMHASHDPMIYAMIYDIHRVGM